MSSIKTLIKGYRRFFRKYYRFRPSIYQKLVKDGQSPKAVMITCSDSRVDPAIVTKAAPGDIFVIRNVANIVPSYDDQDINISTASALEFAIKKLGIAHVIVMGHSDCAGIQTLLKPKQQRDLPLVSDWVDTANSAREQALNHKDLPSHDQEMICSQYSLQLSLEHLATYPFIQEKLANNEISLHAWYLNIHNGELTEYNLQTGKFEALGLANK